MSDKLFVPFADFKEKIDTLTAERDEAIAEADKHRAMVASLMWRPELENVSVGELRECAEAACNRFTYLELENHRLTAELAFTRQSHSAVVETCGKQEAELNELRQPLTEKAEASE